ncbi:MAG: PAC2 family protein [Candidatus Bathyarchaeota archaeon]|nr:PAC2 family protein [Candidatus Bathyarchaeota archaeon]MDH5733041.1 PAC2 family protein [Candidatus Bathyarchaeota archaeon]
MVCVTRVHEKPVLTDPVLIEGLPGIGFVANIAALHLIQELKAKLFAELRSSSFQDFATTAQNGDIRVPINEFYYHKGKNGERDFIILYGNTQALTTVGQYELCGRILDIAEELGCRFIITLGGLKTDRKVDVPKLYCAASDSKPLSEALNLGAGILRGQIFGVAGLLVGLGKLRDIEGICLLAETLGLYPDATAAREILKAIGRILHLEVDLSRLDVAAKTTRSTLESFGLIPSTIEKRTKEEARYRGVI